MRKKTVMIVAVLVFAAAFGLVGCQSDTKEELVPTTAPATAPGAFLYEDYGSAGVCITGLSNDGKKLEEIVVPEEIGGRSVTKIEYGAFYECSNLVSIKLPDSITEIGKDAFRGCDKLSSVNLPEGLISIRECTFYDCSSLKVLIIPETVAEIGLSAFRNSGITNLKIPENVTTLGRAFQDCHSLESITITNGMNFEFEDIDIDFDNSKLVITTKKGWVFSDLSKDVLFIVPRDSEVERWADQEGYKIQYIE